MKPYLDKAPHKFNHILPSTHQDSLYPHELYPHSQSKCVIKEQFTEYDTSLLAGNSAHKYFQNIGGMSLWYASAGYLMMLIPLSALTLQQSPLTVETMKWFKQFLDYAATKVPTVLTYHKVVTVHNYAHDLNECNASSRAGGHHFL